jgi:hypothetical protein
VKAHSPVPWEAEGFDEVDKWTSIYAGEGTKLHEPVCRVPHDDTTSYGMREVEANISLIEAAPEKLAALEAIDDLCVHDGHAEMSRIARAAIAKATRKVRR